MGPPLRRAFTLAELLLSLGLISLGVLALMGVLTISLRTSTQSRQSTQSAQLAQELFEGIRKKGHCPTGTVTYTGQAALDDFPPRPYPSRTVEGTEYSLQVSSQPVSGKPSLYSVKVRVLWSGKYERQYECRFYQP